MKSDVQLRRDILNELEWQPSVDAAEIGVTVGDRVATLAGQVSGYAEKLAAERAAQRVAGVKAVANDLQIVPTGAGKRTDADIARAVANTLAWRASLPHDRIKVGVSNGWVTLEGDVDWQFQREVAWDAVRHLLGVRGVVNNIALKPKASAADLGSRIEPHSSAAPKWMRRKCASKCTATG